MIRRNKGQAAMEFLMTYGWAILVVLAAIGALAYFGVLSPDNFLPSKCTISPQFACTEFKVTNASTNNVMVGIQNNVGGTLSAVNVSLTTSDCTVSGSPWVAPASVANGRQLNSSGLVTFTCPSLSLNDKFQADVEIVYIESGKTLDHTAVGSIQTKVEN